ncbi:Zn-ribbon domain-containing OB-fold protein [Actinoallomurus iriomotensis]|nr:zinc ribbon domain-containing protein [Actinoallomurus iriomotensis]
MTERSEGIKKHAPVVTPSDTGGFMTAAGPIRRDGRGDPFFDGAAEDRLVVPRCASCERWFAPDATGCPGCGTDDLTWAEATGEAMLVSWAVTHSRTGETAPLALVELAEGPWMYTRLETDSPRAGLPLRARFVHPDEGESYPVFEERDR